MKGNTRANVNMPIQFGEKLQHVMEGVYELLELAREDEPSQVSDDGVTRCMEEEGKTCFHVSGQYNRPTEFLQALLDIVRVNYEPYVLGTFFLNSNLCFLYDEIPDAAFRLGYVSKISDAGVKFDGFWRSEIVPYLEECGYDLERATAIYAVATTGAERYGMELVNEIMAELDCGFSVDDACRALASAVNPELNRPRKQVYAGYCLDPALESRIRLSLWMFIPHDDHAVQ